MVKELRKYDPFVLRLAQTGVFLDPYCMNPPIGESGPNDVQFELTVGCSYDKCSYCSDFTKAKFRMKTLEEFKEHVRAIRNHISKPDYRQIEVNYGKTLPSVMWTPQVRRVFIGGANALCVGVDRLKDAIDTINSEMCYFYSQKSRISLFGRVDDILRKGEIGLNDLTWHPWKVKPGYKWPGLKAIYLGLESGSTEALKYGNKGYDKEEILEAIDILNRTRLEVNAMIMPGLGGRECYDSHVQDSIEVLNQLMPKSIDFSAVSFDLNTDYAQKVLEDLDNSNLPLSTPPIN